MLGSVWTVPDDARPFSFRFSQPNARTPRERRRPLADPRVRRVRPAAAIWGDTGAVGTRTARALAGGDAPGARGVAPNDRPVHPPALRLLAREPGRARAADGAARGPCRGARRDRAAARRRGRLRCRGSRGACAPDPGGRGRDGRRRQRVRCVRRRGVRHDAPLREGRRASSSRGASPPRAGRKDQALARSGSLRSQRTDKPTGWTARCSAARSTGTRGGRGQR